MKHFFISILLSFSLLTNIIAQDFERAQEYLNSKGEVYFKFKIENVKKLQSLSQKISIDKIDYANKEIYAYANQKGFNFFSEYEIPFEVLTAPGDLIKNPKMFGVNERATMAWDAYPTYEAYEAMMYQFELDYPSICKIEEIGTTVKGRKLLFAVISDNVAINEAEPRFMYTSTMHGDETTGWIMMLRLIDYLLSNYGTNTQATDIVNNTELWINPLENPDGTYQNDNSTISGCQRYNGNNVDLNRNFKNPEYDHPDGEAWQPESIAMMNLIDSLHFVMSANSHGGIELANYPWDTWTTQVISGNPTTNGYYTTHADQDWWINLASEFRDYAQANSPSGYFTGENNGITHGADWYVVTGSRQAYSNCFGRCREMTLEVSDTKTVAGADLPSYWGYLSESYLKYIEQVQYGIRGIVVDSLTLQPLYANVFVNNHDNADAYIHNDYTDIYTELPYGDYYRPIKAGTYSVTYDANGYLPKTFDITIGDYETLVFDTVKLSPALPSADFTADVTDFCSTPATVNFTNQSTDAGEFYWTFGDGGTSTAENPTHTYLNPGFYNVKLVVQGVFAGSDSITKNSFITIDSSNPCTYDMPTSGTQTLTECGGFLYDDGGVDGPYSANTTMQTTISVTGASFITININSFDIEAGSGGSCDYDYVAFYDGPDDTYPLLNGTYYCNTTGNPGTINSTGSSITIKLYSDQNTTGTGFELEWNCNYPTAPPVADFSYSATESCDGIITFTDLSTNGANAWSWNFGDGETSTLQNPTHTYANNGIYTVSLTATNDFGSDDIIYTNLITINRPSGPTVTPFELCGAQSTTLPVTGTGTLYWYDAQTGGNLLNTGNSYTTPEISSNTTYYVEDYIENITTNNVGMSINLSDGAIYSSSTSHYLIFDAYEEFTLNSVLVYAQGAGNRTIELRNSSGAVLQSTTVNIPDGESRVTLNFDVPVGTDLRLAGPNAPYLFRNSANVSYPYEVPGVVSITTSSAGGVDAPNYYYFFYDWEISQTTTCVSERSAVDVIVHNLPTVDLGAAQETCEGNSVLLNAGTFNTYNWSTLETSSSITVSSSGTYSVTVSDENGCEANDNVLVTINSLPEVSLGNDTTICSGNSLVLNPGTFVDYIWSDNATVASKTINSAGLYAVTVTDNNGCEGSASINIYTQDLPVSQFSETENGDEITFTNSSSNANIYTWNFGDGETSNEINPIHTFSSTGTFVVELTAENSCGTDVSNTTIIIVSSQDIKSNEDVNIYPNPTNSNIFIEASNAFTSYQISDISGKIILTDDINSSITKIDMSNYSKGIYFIKLYTNNKFQIKRFILD